MNHFPVITELNLILKEYAAFESEVMKFTVAFCRSWCSNCKAICCKPEFCRESLDSPFLSMLRKKFQSPVCFDSRRGWCGETGCVLTVGRPPICYEYLCDEIRRSQPTAARRYTTNILSRLITHIGKRALGCKHLVEITDPSDLRRISHARFATRLMEARNAFEIVQSYLKETTTRKDSGHVLVKIAVPPAALYRHFYSTRRIHKKIQQEK